MRFSFKNRFFSGIAGLRVLRNVSFGFQFFRGFLIMRYVLRIKKG